MNAFQSWKDRGLLLFAFSMVSVLWLSSNAGAASLKLSWTDQSSVEQGFKIERAIGTGGSFTQLATVGANVRSYTDSTVSPGNTYCYRVRAYNAAGISAPSNQACANVSTSSASSVSSGGSTGSSSSSGSSSSGVFTAPVSNTTPTLQYANAWANYRFSLKMKSNDDDVIGVMFRYVDQDNYYRFLWYREQNLRRLEKQVKGRFYTLAEDAVPYNKGQIYELEIVANGSTLDVIIDGRKIFSEIDSSIKSGTIALYSNYNSASIFDDVLVQDLRTGSVLVWDDFNDTKTTGWVVVNEGREYGPSSWVISNGWLLQSSNIGSSKARDWLGTYVLYSY